MMSALNKQTTNPVGATMDATVLELLASRICHDLISPVGAVHNGVEFLEDMGMGDHSADAIGLIAHSAQQASAKLQVFRLAYGAGGRDPNITPDDIYKAFDNLVTNDGKVKQDWDSKASLFGEEERPEGFCKILMGAMLMAQETLIKGGTISVVPGVQSGSVHVVASGPDVTIRENVREALALALDPSDLDPRLVHPYVLSVIAQQYGYKINILEENVGTITFILSR
jgi:histidine phosphotransferase ChpT